MRIYFVLLELLFISISALINGQNPKQYELDYGVSYEPEYFDNYANDRYFNELKAFFDRYTERKQARHFAIKREALINEGGFYRPVGNFEWLKRNPKSVLVGSIAAVTLFLGLVLTVGIVVRRRYLINSSSPSKSLIGQEAGDKKLAHSAQMYHYQFQKQQILAMEKASIKNEQSEDEGTDVETDGDFAVYECSGIPKTNEMEVKNPFFAGGKQSSEEGNCNADDELINTSQRSSLENSDTFVEDKRKEVESAKINKKN